MFSSTDQRGSLYGGNTSAPAYGGFTGAPQDIPGLTNPLLQINLQQLNQNILLSVQTINNLNKALSAIFS